MTCSSPEPGGVQLRRSVSRRAFIHTVKKMCHRPFALEMNNIRSHGISRETCLTLPGPLPTSPIEK